MCVWKGGRVQRVGMGSRHYITLSMLRWADRAGIALVGCYVQRWDRLISLIVAKLL